MKTFDQVLAAKNFEDKYLVVPPGSNELHGCFFYCSGKYTYYANLIDDIREDMWHQNRYIQYLEFLVNKNKQYRY